MLHRRSFRRFVRLDCQVVRERDLRTIGDLALDLSTEGMLVRGTDRVLTGEEVIVSFRPPRSNRLIDAMGTIARVVRDVVTVCANHRTTCKSRREPGVSLILGSM